MSSKPRVPRGTPGEANMYGWETHTTDGETRLWIAHDNKIWWFKKSGHTPGKTPMELTHVEVLDGDDVSGEHYSYVELPKKVKKRLKQENVRMVSDTLARCM